MTNRFSADKVQKIVNNHLMGADDLVAPAAAPALPDGWLLADHPEYGRVVVVRPEPDEEGDVAIIVSEPTNIDHAAMTWCKPNDLTYLAQGAHTSGAVSPNTLDLGSMWIDSGALAQACKESERDQIVALDNTGEAYVWSWDADWWEGSVPPQFAPFTIINDGKKAHQ